MLKGIDIEHMRINKRKLGIIFFTLISISSLGIGVIAYFFSQSIINKKSIAEKIDIDNDNYVNIHKQMNKYELAQNAYTYYDYINNKKISFNHNFVATNLYKYINECLENYYSEKNINISNVLVYFQIINYNILNIVVKWSIKYNVGNVNIVDNCYDKFSLKVDKKSG